jgi:hypothetical protein
LNHPNDDCELGEKTTRTSSNITKSGSAIETKSFQKEEEVRKRPIGEAIIIYWSVELVWD